MEIKAQLKYMSHLPLLNACLNENSRPILELGMGLGSTPLLNALSFNNRKIYSFETNEQWINPFKIFLSNDHNIYLLKNWNEVDKFLDIYNWGLVFVDQSPAADRGPLIDKLKDKAELIVLHDANHLRNCRAKEIFKEMKFKFVFDKFKPWTCVLSNVNNLDFLKQYNFGK